MKVWVCMCMALIFLTVSAFSAGEFYRYKDEDGNIRFTDDLNQVPLDQRPKVYQKVKSEPSAFKQQSEPLNLNQDQKEELKKLEQKRDMLETHTTSMREEMEQAGMGHNIQRTPEEAGEWEERLRQFEADYNRELSDLREVERQIFQIKSKAGK